MAKDLHRKHFDEGTIVKLTLFSNYLNEWLRVFIEKKAPIWKTINICDFFAGPGYDSNKSEGSPIIILNKIKYYNNKIKEKGFNVNVILNEKIPSKYKQLQEATSQYKNLQIDLKLRNKNFIETFEEFYTLYSNSANLLFLDQNGIKQITKEVFLKIINLKTTDFLFFTSSSYLKRFSNIAYINKYLKIPVEKVKQTSYYDIHRLVKSAYKGFIPTDKEYHLTSFSIKKGSNIYGLIFGSNHILGIEKFLDVSWKMDPIRGEANFDIDEDRININAPSFFDEFNKPTKVKLFETELEKLILNEKLKTNRDIILFTITNGFLISHATNIIKQMVQERKIPIQSLKLGQKVYRDSFNIVEIKLN